MGALDRHTPIPLGMAASEAFPAGMMTAAGLRREGQRGNLAIMRINGRDWTTLADIEDMKRRCRVQPKVPGSTSSRPAGQLEAKPADLPDGSSETAPRCTPQDALQAKLQRLTKPSPTTSKRPTGRRAQNVVPMPSRSRTC